MTCVMYMDTILIITLKAFYLYTEIVCFYTYPLICEYILVFYYS